MSSGSLAKFTSKQIHAMFSARCDTVIDTLFRPDLPIAELYDISELIILFLVDLIVLILESNLCKMNL